MITQTFYLFNKAVLFYSTKPVRRSSDDADRAIQQKADAYGARYYTITLKQEHELTNMWTSRAVLYR
ncbi:DUF1471 domain-containing protein [BEV proteobacterium]|nr:DUF1471 domain-containing protein [Candidatus Symbiopectobacterium sp. Chty_BC]